MSVKLYHLPVVIHQPSEQTEGKYLVEAPSLPGCRAWGDTPGKALEYLQSVATAFVESYRAHNQPIPIELEAAAIEIEGQQEARGEVVVIG